MPLLKRLNENVIVTETHSVDIPYMYIEDIFRLANFDCVVVLDNFDKAFLKSLGDQCHNAQKGFIYGGNIGLYGFLFVDFGEKHTVFDDNGEPEQPIHI